MKEIPAGTRLNAVLVNSVHSALSGNGDGLRAILLRPSRWLHRASGFRLGFQQISGARGQPAVEIAAAVSALDPAEKSSLRVDPEGAISGEPQSKGKMLLHLGVSYVTGKVLDDLMEEGIKAGLGWPPPEAAPAARHARVHRDRNHVEPPGPVGGYWSSLSINRAASGEIMCRGAVSSIASRKCPCPPSAC